MTAAGDDSAQVHERGPARADAARARELLSAENLSCAAVHGANVLTSRTPGSLPSSPGLARGKTLMASPWPTG